MSACPLRDTDTFQAQEDTPKRDTFTERKKTTVEPYDCDRAVLAINMLRNHLADERGGVLAGVLLGESLEKIAGLMAITVELGRRAFGGVDQLDAHLRDSLDSWDDDFGPQRPIFAARLVRAHLSGDRATVGSLLDSGMKFLAAIQAEMLVLAVGAGRHAFDSDMDAFAAWLDDQAEIWRHRD